MFDDRQPRNGGRLRRIVIGLRHRGGPWSGAYRRGARPSPRRSGARSSRRHAHGVPPARAGGDIRAASIATALQLVAFKPCPRHAPVVILLVPSPAAGWIARCGTGKAGISQGNGGHHDRRCQEPQLAGDGDLHSSSFIGVDWRPSPRGIHVTMLTWSSVSPHGAIASIRHRTAVFDSAAEVRPAPQQLGHHASTDALQRRMPITSTP